jgi:hypothetical protein
MLLISNNKKRWASINNSKQSKLHYSVDPSYKTMYNNTTPESKIELLSVCRNNKMLIINSERNREMIIHPKYDNIKMIEGEEYVNKILMEFDGRTDGFAIKCSYTNIKMAIDSIEKLYVYDNKHNKGKLLDFVEKYYQNEIDKEEDKLIKSNKYHVTIQEFQSLTDEKFIKLITHYIKYQIN